MGRYRLRINPNLDQSLVLDNPEDLNFFLSGTRERILEIGSGMGEFLVNLALTKPDLIFLGLEWQRIRVLKSTELIWKNRLSNIRFMQMYVDEKLPDLLGNFSFKEIHINHPDPWEKKRQRKRRIIRPDMLQVFQSLLEPYGDLWITTDHVEYGSAIHKLLSDSNYFSLIEDSFLNENNMIFSGRVATRFQKKLNEKGFPSRIFRAKKNFEYKTVQIDL